MKQASLVAVGLVVLCAGIVAVSWLDSDRSGGQVVATTRVQGEGSPDRPDLGAVERAERAEARAQERTGEGTVAPAEEHVSEPEPAGLEGPAVEPEPDLEATDTIEILVVDERRLPVTNARVRIHGLRRARDSGSWYSYRGGENPSGMTDGNGKVALDYWTWVNQDGRTIEVDLLVHHPDYVAFRDSSFAIGPGERVVVLKAGTTVVVSGWIGSRDVVVHDLEVRVDRESRLGSGDWRREEDGRLSTNRLGPGEHFVQIQHRSATHGRCQSAIEAFELAENEWKELHLELDPEHRFEGRLEASVSRPVIDGHVLLSLHQGGLRADEPTLERRFEARIEPDGSFVFEGLPPGRGQVFALCQGWVSRRTIADNAAEAGLSSSGERTPEQERELLRGMGGRAMQPQRVRVPFASSSFVLLMEPTGTLEVTVTREDGTPLVDARAFAWPNVHFFGVGSFLVPWHEWHAATDHEGRARIIDLPPRSSLRIGAEHASYEMRRSDREKLPKVTILPGERATATIVLEPMDHRR